MGGFLRSACIFLVGVGQAATAQVYKCEGGDGVAVYQQFPCPDQGPTVGETPRPPAPASIVDDPSAWIERHEFDGRVACMEAVEDMARHRHRWTAGLFHDHFSTISLVSRQTGFIMFAGDRIEMQNALGAWLPVSYGCIFDPTENTASAFQR